MTGTSSTADIYFTPALGAKTIFQPQATTSLRTFVSGVIIVGGIAVLSQGNAAADTDIPTARAPMVSLQTAAPANSEAARFKTLTDRWVSETSILSDPRMFLNPAYLQIIAMGYQAVPLILERMKTEPDHWFVALSSITGTDAAANEDDLVGATNSWLAWGKAQGFVN